ncbi:MAG TPA: TetR/AcrR family transcriptional regulator [Solirubrobacteraceae bacterium]|nr:TetR/AcrR family transcriptional regulator [Solirubrobacteraceae bacterium]
MGTTEADATGARADRPLSGEKAQRIIEAMRSNVARRGLAGATFDQVARDAGVSRGLLHYYFGTKEHLLVQAVRHDCELRLASLRERLVAAKRADDFIALMAMDLQEGLTDDPDFTTLIFEMFTLARRNDEVALEFADLLRRTRETVTEILTDAQGRGVVALTADPASVTDVLFALADGFALRILSEPERDFRDSIITAVRSTRPLLGS